MNLASPIPNLYPKGLALDPSAQHFLVGSLRNRTITVVSDVGVIKTLISNSSLPENVTVLGLALDSTNHSLLAIIHAADPLPHFDAFVPYDLRLGNHLFLSLLPSDDAPVGTHQTANDVTVDFKGNAYITNSAGNYIWKVNADGD
jgi:DNA-binding beta-propeller fold protein YncE